MSWVEFSLKILILCLLHKNKDNTLIAAEETSKIRNQRCSLIWEICIFIMLTGDFSILFSEHGIIPSKWLLSQALADEFECCLEALTWALYHVLLSQSLLSYQSVYKEHQRRSVFVILCCGILALILEYPMFKSNPLCSSVIAQF